MALLDWFLLFAVYSHLYVIDTRGYEFKTKRIIDWVLFGCLVLYVIMAFIYPIQEATLLQLGFLAGIGFVTGVVSALYIVPINRKRFIFILILTIVIFVITAIDEAMPYLKM